MNASTATTTARTGKGFGRRMQTSLHTTGKVMIRPEAGGLTQGGPVTLSVILEALKYKSRNFNIPTLSTSP